MAMIGLDYSFENPGAGSASSAVGSAQTSLESLISTLDELVQKLIEIQSKVSQTGSAASDAAKKAADPVSASAEQAKAAISKVTDFGTQAFDQLFAHANNGWSKLWTDMQKSALNGFSSILSDAIVKPAATSALNSIFGISSSGGGGSGSSALASLLGFGGGGSSNSGGAGGQNPLSFLGIGGQGGLLDSAGQYLFGTSYATVATPEIASQTVSLGELSLDNGATVPITGEMPGVSSGSMVVGSTDGLLGSGGASNALAGAGPLLGAAGLGAFEGGLIGSNVHSPGLSALGGAASGALTGFAIAGPYGAIVGGLAGAIAGALSGQHPTVGPNEGGYVFTKNGVATAGPTGADNGGSVQEAQQLQQAVIAGIGNLTASISGIGNLTDIRVGAFGGKYFGTTDPNGGSPQNAIYTNAADAVANGILESLKSSDLSKIDPNVATAIQHIPASSAGAITSASTISSDLTFAEQFNASIAAMKNGVTNFSQAAQVAAQTTSTQLVSQIENFRTQTAALGLDTKAAADATKSAVESFLGITKSQPVSQLEANVETLYGKLQGVSGLLSEVGIDQATATKSVADQVRQLLGLTSSAAVGPVTAQVQSLKTTFSDLAPILQALGISSDEAAKALANATQKLTATANASLQTNIDSLTGSLTSQINAIVASFKGTFQDVQAGLVDSNLAQTDMALQISKLYQPQIQAAEQAVTTAFNSEISRQQGIGSAASQAASSIRQFSGGLALGSLSPLSPQDQLSAAKSAFDQAVQQSHSSDPTVAANAEAQITTLAQNYLTASKNVNASSAAYAADYNYVQKQLGDVQSAAESQAQIAQQQVTLLQQQLAAATGTQTNTLSTAQAIQQLNQLMAQVNATIAKSIAAAGGGTWNGLATPNANAPAGVSVGPGGSGIDKTGASLAVEFAYNQYLGRQGSSDEVAWYANQITAGTLSLAQMQTYFTNSPEYLAEHPASKSALGNIFAGGNVVPFARGGAFTNSVVGSPTLAPLALFGEAGPEAILPLSRTSGGALGVKSSGSDPALISEISALRGQVAQLQTALVQVTAQGSLAVKAAVEKGNKHLARTAQTARLGASNPVAA